MTTPITVLPVPPATSDPVNFDVRADEFLGALPTFRTELNTLGNEVEVLGATATTQAGIATTQAALATTNGATQVALATTQVALATTQANIATTQAGIATAAALTAINAPGTNATSTTSDTIALGSTTITVQTGKALTVGMFVLQASTVNPANYNYGQITSYDIGTGVLDINVLLVGGGGTATAWTVSLAAITSAAQPMTKGRIFFFANN